MFNLLKTGNFNDWIRFYKIPRIVLEIFWLLLWTYNTILRTFSLNRVHSFRLTYYRYKHSAWFRQIKKISWTYKQKSNKENFSGIVDSLNSKRTFEKRLPKTYWYAFHFQVVSKYLKNIQSKVKYWNSLFIYSYHSFSKVRFSLHFSVPPPLPSRLFHIQICQLEKLFLRKIFTKSEYMCR